MTLVKAWYQRLIDFELCTREIKGKSQRLSLISKDGIRPPSDTFEGLKNTEQSTYCGEGEW